MVTLSVITATFNSAKTIHNCLESVLANEVFSEHIVIDGGSDDETVELVRSYPHVTRIISEPDDGIYHAMNKGIALSNGDIVGILNSDDFYADSEVLRKVLNVFTDPCVDSCFGDLQYVDADDTSRITREWRAGSFTENGFMWGWMPPHPTFFVRRRIYERYGLFRLDFGSAADYEIMLRFLVKHSINAIYIPEILVKMRSGGVSNASIRNRLKANQMDRRAWHVNGLKPYPWTTLLKPFRKVFQYRLLTRRSLS